MATCFCKRQGALSAFPSQQLQMKPSGQDLTRQSVLTLMVVYMTSSSSGNMSSSISSSPASRISIPEDSTELLSSSLPSCVRQAFLWFFVTSNCASHARHFLNLTAGAPRPPSSSSFCFFLALTGSSVRSMTVLRFPGADLAEAASRRCEACLLHSEELLHIDFNTMRRTSASAFAAEARSAGRSPCS